MISNVLETADLLNAVKHMAKQMAESEWKKKRQEKKKKRKNQKDQESEYEEEEDQDEDEEMVEDDDNKEEDEEIDEYDVDPERDDESEDSKQLGESKNPEPMNQVVKETKGNSNMDTDSSYYETNDRNQSIYEKELRLRSRKLEAQEHLRELRSKAELKEIRDKPKLNKNSAKIARALNQQPIYIRYKDIINSKKEKQVINSTLERNTQSCGKYSGQNKTNYSDQQQFVNSQLLWLEIKNHKLQRKREDIQEHEERKVQAYFKPKINKKSSDIDLKGLPIHERLFRHAKIQEKQMDHLTKIQKPDFKPRTNSCKEGTYKPNQTLRSSVGKHKTYLDQDIYKVNKYSQMNQSNRKSQDFTEQRNNSIIKDLTVNEVVLRPNYKDNIFLSNKLKSGLNKEFVYCAKGSARSSIAVSLENNNNNTVIESVASKGTLNFEDKLHNSEDSFFEDKVNDYESKSTFKINITNPIGTLHPQTIVLNSKSDLFSSKYDV